MRLGLSLATLWFLNHFLSYKICTENQFKDILMSVVSWGQLVGLISDVAVLSYSLFDINCIFLILLWIKQHHKTVYSSDKFVGRAYRKPVSDKFVTTNNGPHIFSVGTPIILFRQICGNSCSHIFIGTEYFLKSFSE